MLWQTVKSYWRGIVVTLGGISAVLGALWAGSGFVFAADDYKEAVDNTIVLAQTNEKSLEQLVEIQQAAAREKEADLKARLAVYRERAKLCMAEKLNDPALCAEAYEALR